MKQARFICLLALLLTLPLLSSAQGTLPSMRFTGTDQQPLSNKDIPKGKALMLVYFRSDCDHCQHTAQQLRKSAASYPLTIWMVSAEPIPTLQTFESMTGLYEADNLVMMQDHSQSMHTWFDFSKLPFIVLFDKQGKQRKTFEELPAPATVKKILSGQ